MFEQQIAAGIEWLDERVNDWRRKVNAELLDMKWPTDCILGQIGNAIDGSDYYDVCAFFGWFAFGSETNRYGFNTAWDWDILTDEWKAALSTDQAVTSEQG